MDGGAFDGGDGAVLLEADLEAQIGLGPAAVGDEGLLAAGDDADRALGGARQQGADEVDVQGLGARPEAAADVRLDDADARLLHLQGLGQHEVHVIGHLGRGADRDAPALGVVIGEDGVGLALHLADLGTIVGLLAHQVGGLEAAIDVAEFELGVAVDVARALGVELDGAFGARLLRGVVGGQFLVGELDGVDGALGGLGVDGGDRRQGLAPVAHPAPRHGVFVLGDGQDAVGLVAVVAGDDGDDAGKKPRRRGVEAGDLGVADRASEDAPDEGLEADQVGRVTGSAGDLVGAVDKRLGHADGAHGGGDAVHAVVSRWASSRAAAWTASMIFT